MSRSFLFALAALGVLVLSTPPAFAQDDLGALLDASNADSGSESGMDSVPDYVQVRAYLDRDAYHAGDTARISVEIKIDPSVHVNGNVPTLDFQVPTELTWDDLPAGLEVSSITWPKPKMAAFEFSEGKKIAVYEGTVRALLTAKIPRAEPTTYKLTGSLRAQGCTHTVCYAPQKDPLKLTIRVVGADEETQPVNDDKFGATGTSDKKDPHAAEGPEGDEPVAEMTAATEHAAPAGTLAAVDGSNDPDCLSYGKKRALEDFPILMVYLLAFGGGIVLAFTPCVLPLVPITIGFFSRQRTDGGSPLPLATLYVLGLASVYTVLGTVAALTGSLFGSVLQNPIVLVGMALLLGCLALSMFGLLPDLTLPTAISSKIGGGRGGKAGAALMGGAMGLVAAPCVGPLVASLLGYVAKLGAEMSKGSAALLGGSLFFVLSIGLGLPFFLVGMGIAQVRPGAWMVTVKKVLGFVILGVALWFVRPVIHDRAFQIGIVIVLVTAAYYLFTHATELAGRLRTGARVAAAVSAVAAVSLGLAFAGLVKLPGAHARHEFVPYSEALVAQARERAQPVVIDFGAEWCVACKKLEADTFPHEDVQREFDKGFVLLRADMTEEEDPAVLSLREKYDVGSLPTIMFLDSSGQEVRDLRLKGPESPEDFAARVRCVRSLEVASK